MFDNFVSFYITKVKLHNCIEKNALDYILTFNHTVHK